MVYASKFKLVGELIYAAILSDENDIYYKPLESEDWDLLFQHYSYYEPKNLKKFIKQYKDVTEFMAFGSAFMSKAEDSNKLKQAFATINYALFYLLFKRKRLEQFDLFMANPDVDIALKFYNLPDTDFMMSL